MLASLGSNEDIREGTYKRQGLIQLWNPNTGQLLHTLKDDLVPNSMVFSPDGQTLTSLSREVYEAHLRTWT
ncbi:MAG TPA: hypothetical protein V6D14_34575 [Coleofasciculaceae cyanobacterium]